MTNNDPTSNTNTATLEELTNFGTVTLHGAQGLVLARQALEHLMTQAGYTIQFDPSSAPDLLDYLAVTTVSSFEGAIVGGGIGTLLGLLVDRPGVGLAIGVGLGLLAGASRGVQRVKVGWRVQAVREHDGEARIIIESVGLT